MKLLGAALILTASVITGAALYGGLAARVRALRALIASLEVMAGEIGARLTPMKEVLFLLSRTCVGAAAGFYGAVLEGMDRLGEVTFSEIWEAALSRTLPALHPEDREILSELGASLGRYDAASGAAIIGRAKARLEVNLAGAEETRRREGRLRLFLPVAAAVFAVVMFI